MSQGLMKRVPCGTAVSGRQLAIRPCVPWLARARQSTSRVAVVAQAGKLDSVPLFGGESSTFGSSPTFDSAKAAPKLNIDDVPLESDAGMSYVALRDALAKQDFRAADDETRALLIRLAGEGAVKRNWVYFTEVKTMPEKDLQTIDALWKAASNGKFGFTVQREMWNQAAKRWPKFFKQIDWVQGDNNNYRKWPAEFDYTLNAVRGHLPLTNALRGTQLFEALLNHPAFEKKEAKKQSIDERSAAQAKGTLKW